MSPVDCFPGERARRMMVGDKGDLNVDSEAEEEQDGGNGDDNLLVIHPMVDGRLKDEGRK